jgi:hypothetical protein
MILGATGTLTRASHFQFGDDFIDSGGIAYDRFGDGAAA